MTTAEVVICGSGIAGIATAYYLAVHHSIKDVLLVDERPPLTFTSDKSTECYRNWWPGPGDAMVRLMNRSIDIMECLAAESSNRFLLNRRGYLFATADPERIQSYQEAGEQAARLGAGELRLHETAVASYQPFPANPEDFDSYPTGADLIVNRELIRRHYPYLAEKTIAILHVRRAGWLSAQQLGMYMLEQALRHGVRFQRGIVTGVVQKGNKVQRVLIKAASRDLDIATPVFVDAAGPYLKRVGAILGVNLPVFTELHMKVALNDYLGVVPRQAPLLIWGDPQKLPWSAAEKREFRREEESRWLLEQFPSGVHTRPEGGPGSQMILILWDYHNQVVEPEPAPMMDPLYPEIAIRGLAKMLPGMKAYSNKMPRPILDGGYYVKTVENRPLIGPLPTNGAFVIGALSGYGIMASCAAGELLATHIAGNTLPDYAPAFTLSRYEDPAYRHLLASWSETWQL